MSPGWGTPSFGKPSLLTQPVCQHRSLTGRPAGLGRLERLYRGVGRSASPGGRQSPGLESWLCHLEAVGQAMVVFNTKVFFKNESIKCSNRVI